MTSSPTYPSLFFSGHPPPTTPSFFPPCLAHPSRTLADAFRRFSEDFSEDALHQSEAPLSNRQIWSHLSHDVSLMSFLRLDDVIFSPTALFNSQSEAKVLARKFKCTNHKPPFPTVKSGLIYPIVLLSES